MKVLSIILIVALIVFTIWQAYLTVKKILLKRKQSSVVAQNKSNLDTQVSNNDNSIKEVKE